MAYHRSYQIIASSARKDWSEVPALPVDQYLWLDNGYAPKVEVRSYYTAERLYVQFKVDESHPLVRYHQPNEPVYTDSCVEFFVQPLPGSDARYLNFELNAAGTLLLQLGEGRDRKYLEDAPPALFEIQTSYADREQHPEESGWELEFSIPFDWLTGLFPDFTVSSGQVLRGNFYKCGDETELPHYGSWNRVDSATPNFHLSASFGELVLE
ncbi:carbohydrate-binding family 9-like protein [Paenibacillus sp. NPDC056722]|uniref:carbohydrate-binding family 9-like protein n=1 Tax=Paenibacillus sp. NPDC056722 TaxID=3345924 RepID=UPI0036C74180